MAVQLVWEKAKTMIRFWVATIMCFTWAASCQATSVATVVVDAHSNFPLGHVEVALIGSEDVVDLSRQGDGLILVVENSGTTFGLNFAKEGYIPAVYEPISVTQTTVKLPIIEMTPAIAVDQMSLRETRNLLVRIARDQEILANGTSKRDQALAELLEQHLRGASIHLKQLEAAELKDDAQIRPDESKSDRRKPATPGPQIETFREGTLFGSLTEKLLSQTLFKNSGAFAIRFATTASTMVTTLNKLPTCSFSRCRMNGVSI